MSIESIAIADNNDHFIRSSCIHWVRLLCLFFVVCSPLDGDAQTDVTGFIKEALTGEPIINASVTVLDYDNGTLSNAEGYFHIRLNDAASPALVIQAFGYDSDTLRIDDSRGSSPQVVYLTPYTLSTVKVVANANAATDHPGVIRPVLSELRNLPTLLGEPDLLRSLTIYPGIANGIEGTTGLHVRGGSPDQNLMLLDGGTVYNSGHLFGFLSVFNPSVLKAVALHRGYIPSRFHGRLSSVLEVHTKAGRSDRRAGEASLGIINSSLHFEGPVKKEGSATYLVGARTAHSLPLTLAASLLSNEDNGSVTSLLAGMYDINARYTTHDESGAGWSVGLYTGSDLSQSTTKDFDIKNTFKFGYRNTVLSARYTRPLSTAWFSTTSLVGTNYIGKLTARAIARSDEAVSIKFANTSTIGEGKVDQQLTSTNGLGTFRVGLEAQYRRTQPLSLTGDVENVESFLPTVFSNWKFAAFAEQLIEIRRVRFSVGLNGTRYSAPETNYTFSTVEPRLGLIFQVTSQLDASLSYSRMVQDAHYVTGVGADLPYDVWLPLTDATPAAYSDNFSFEVKGSGAGWEYSMAAFHRNMSGLITTRNSNFTFYNSGSGANYFDQLASDGIGESYGLEIFTQHTRPRASYTIAYTLSRSFRSFSAINQGERFPYRFDRPHDLLVNVGHQLSNRWRVSGSFSLQSGSLLTVPTGFAVSIDGEPLAVYNRRNNARLPIYHRLDLMFSKAIQVGRHNRDGRLDVGVYNIYARANASFATARVGTTQEEFFGSDTGAYLFFLRGTVFRAVPTVSYSWSW